MWVPVGHILLCGSSGSVTGLPEPVYDMVGVARCHEVPLWTHNVARVPWMASAPAGGVGAVGSVVCTGTVFAPAPTRTHSRLLWTYSPEDCASKYNCPVSDVFAGGGAPKPVLTKVLWETGLNMLLFFFFFSLPPQ